MKIAPLAGVLLVLVGGYYVYKKYQIVEVDQSSQVSQNKEKDIGDRPKDPFKKLPPAMPSSASVDSVKNTPNDDTAAYRDIDRLKGHNSVEAIDSLLKYLDHSNDWVKAHALKALREIGSPRALPRVVAMLEDKGNELAIRGAYMVIGSIGPKLTSAEERRMAVDGLKKSLDLYREGADSESRGNMYVLIEAAGKVPGPEAGEFLLAELPKFHELPHVQYSIIKALGATQYKPAEEALKRYRSELVKEGPEPWGDKERYSDLLKAVDESISMVHGK